MRIFIALIILWVIVLNVPKAFSQSSYSVPKQYQEVPTETMAAAIRRATPLMPKAAEMSGYCCMNFGVTEKGRPQDIQAYKCSDKIFEKNAIKSVKKWRFNPAIVKGSPVKAIDQKTLITFLLADKDGNIVPDPQNLMVRNGKPSISSNALCPPQ